MTKLFTCLERQVDSFSRYKINFLKLLRDRPIVNTRVRSAAFGYACAVNLGRCPVTYLHLFLYAIREQILAVYCKCLKRIFRALLTYKSEVTQEPEMEPIAHFAVFCS